MISVWLKCPPKNNLTPQRHLLYKVCYLIYNVFHCDMCEKKGFCYTPEYSMLYLRGTSLYTTSSCQQIYITNLTKLLSFYLYFEQTRCTQGCSTITSVIHSLTDWSSQWSFSSKSSKQIWVLGSWNFPRFFS